MESRTHAVPVEVDWFAGRLLRATAGRQTPTIEIATPPQFHGGMTGIWSPEDMLVLASASRFMLTLLSVCERRAIPLHALHTSAVGLVGSHTDGRFGFTRIALTVQAETPAAHVAALEAAAETAKGECIVDTALEPTLELTLEISVTDATSFLQAVPS